VRGGLFLCRKSPLFTGKCRPLRGDTEFYERNPSRLRKSRRLRGNAVFYGEMPFSTRKIHGARLFEKNPLISEPVAEPRRGDPGVEIEVEEDRATPFSLELEAAEAAGQEPAVVPSCSTATTETTGPRPRPQRERELVARYAPGRHPRPPREGRPFSFRGGRPPPSRRRAPRRRFRSCWRGR
jgi:hypothetical protein